MLASPHTLRDGILRNERATANCHVVGCGTARPYVQRSLSVVPPGRPCQRPTAALVVVVRASSLVAWWHDCAMCCFGIRWTALLTSLFIHREAADAKAAEAARKKAERDALLAEENASLPSRPGPKNAKTAVKKTKGLDLSSLDEALPALNASGIDNAMDAFEVLDASSSTIKIDRRPEKRTKAAFAVFKERREKELKAEGKNHSQRKDALAEEWKKHPDNPKNQVHAEYNSTKQELKQIVADENAKIENRLAA